MLVETMPALNDDFNDPQLKGALQRLYGQTRADADLRQRVVNALGGEPAAGAMKITPSRSVWKIAAAVLIAIGAAGSIGYQLLEPRWRAARVQAIADARAAENDRQQKVELYGWMITQLADPPASAVVASNVTADSVPAVVAKLDQSLTRKLPSMPAVVGPWTMTRVSVVPFKQGQVARFDYANGDRRVAFVSLPLSCAASLEYAKDYDVQQDGHAIAGYVADDGLNCIVGDARMTAAEAIAFRDAVHAKL